MEEGKKHEMLESCQRGIADTLVAKYWARHRKFASGRPQNGVWSLCGSVRMVPPTCREKKCQ